MTNLNIVFKLTTVCPAQCTCCINRKNKMKMENENNVTFDLSLFKRICEIIKNIGAEYVVFSGGEPTCLPNLTDYFIIAHDYGLKIKMNTNGWNITENLLKHWIDLGLEEVILSIYSLNKENVKRIRGNDKLYTKSLEAISILSRHTSEIKLILQTVIMKNNYAELPALLDLAFTQKANLFWASYLEDAINLPESRMEPVDIQHFKASIVPQMKDVISKCVIESKRREYLVAEVSKYYMDQYHGCRYHDIGYKCEWLGRHITFYPNGMAYPCPGHEYFYSSNERHFDYGQIDGKSIVDFLDKNQELTPQYCVYCPQGCHHELKLK